ncbi:MAG: Txe/YoeB family addiction module toxin [Lachnospiraceae bacterium]|nr:Txe/YoeB family addiction module toxin [Lachnospiraceae bacterium]
MYRIVYTKQAAKDANNLKSCGLDKKARELIEVMKQNPFQNPPAYEKLVGSLQGFCSRRINIQHRIIFQVIEEKHTYDDIEYQGYVKIIRMWTHYER